MSKRLKILISVLVAVTLLVVGSTATVMAQEKPMQEELAEPGQELAPCFGGKGLVTKVADILGMTPEELIDIFEQAQGELSYEAFIACIEKAEAEGIITPEEAEEIITWWENRPEALDCLFPCPHISTAIRSRYMRGDGENGASGLFYSSGNTEQIKLQLRNRLNASDCPAPRVRIQETIRSSQHITNHTGWQ